jgi:hypothetical protein
MACWILRDNQRAMEESWEGQSVGWYACWKDVDASCYKTKIRWVDNKESRQ